MESPWTPFSNATAEAYFSGFFSVNFVKHGALHCTLHHSNVLFATGLVESLMILKVIVIVPQLTSD